MFPAFWAAPERTVPRPPASGRHTPSHPHIGTTVLLPDSVVSPLSQTTGRGRSADTHLQGRGRPCRLGSPGLGMDDLTIRVHNTGLQPFADQVEKGPVVETQAQHVQQPRMVHVIERLNT